ncbi:Atrial natriuretic peptide-converting enzyme [Eumeta japonica]|uniref:Atrial natriuretic peptide-converting enzyme n=1 Tax=Eumeta variegata TaxID=151549 RepID=A0A4C1X7Q9_EUMVA|nr:Atrial natriuretic peptide-converting enzyme [Eumeta japonica]
MQCRQCRPPLGYGWAGNGARRPRPRPPESTMSVGSDIRFTRRKLSRPWRGCCAALATLLVLLLLAAIAIYVAREYRLLSWSPGPPSGLARQVHAARPQAPTLAARRDKLFIAVCCCVGSILVFQIRQVLHRGRYGKVYLASSESFVVLGYNFKPALSDVAQKIFKADAFLLLFSIVIHCVGVLKSHHLESKVKLTSRYLRVVRGTQQYFEKDHRLVPYKYTWSNRLEYRCHIRTLTLPYQLIRLDSIQSRSSRILDAPVIFSQLDPLDMYLFGDPLNRQTFRGSFVVTSWGAHGDDRENTLGLALHDVYQGSDLRSCFVGADVLALDSAAKGDRAHFEVSFEPIFTAVSTAEVREVLQRALAATADGAAAPPALHNITALPDTLHLEENTVISSQALEETESTPIEIPTTEASSFEEEDIRECTATSLSLCSHLPYNSTTYPNLVGHGSRDALLRDLVAYRELLDAECSHLAQFTCRLCAAAVSLLLGRIGRWSGREIARSMLSLARSAQSERDNESCFFDFVCQMLQPRCSENRVVRPCHAYCRAFHAGCGSRLPERLRPHFDCARFPDYFGPDSCNPEPECRAGLERLALSRRACDGVPDCADASDERGCAHCAGPGLRCALHKHCLAQHLRCDGTPDCPDASDEAGCLWVARSLSGWRRELAESTMGAVRTRGGYAVWAERGRFGKLCAAPYQQDRTALASLAASLCRSLTFSGAAGAEVVLDSEAPPEDEPASEAPDYVEVVDPFAPEISFIRTDCPERRVLKVVCDQLECGIASARGARAAAGVEGLGRSALPGDWPWQAALLRTHVHACDAALVHPAWLITTAACFQGQPKAEWSARLGTVRIQSTTPWQQERRIVGMVRSPVEGSMLALVRLEEPVEMTDFVRPICLPEAGADLIQNNEAVTCNALTWTRHRDQLQRVQVTPAPMQNCENVSIATVNGICAEPLYDQDDCDKEEYAGSSMVCFDERSKRWSLAGVSGWRIACSKIGLGRPRIYDSVASHLDWVRRTVSDAAHPAAR